MTLGTSDTDVVVCPATLEGAAVLMVGNRTGSAVTCAMKIYKQSLGTTVSFLAALSIAANSKVKMTDAAISLEAGDKIIMSAASANALTVTGAFNVSGGAAGTRPIEGKGEWDSAATYQQNNIVGKNGNAYLSLIDDNTNQNPDTATDAWMLFAEKGDPGELTAANNLSDVANAATALANLDGSGITRQSNPQTGTAYTLALTDRGKIVTLSNAAAITLTVPPNSSVAFSVNTQIDLAALGAGQVTVAQGAGVTVVSEDSMKKLYKQYSTATLLKTGTDTWLLTGSLAP